MKTLRTYYCVQTRFYDDGRVSAVLLNSREDYKLPESSFFSARHCDVYHDWFLTVSDAEKFIEDTYKA